MSLERGNGRVGAGCGVTAAFALATLVITFGGVLLQQLHPSYVAHPGAGQGEGMLAGMVILAAPVVGVLSALRPRLGIGLGAVILLLLLAFHIVAILQI